MSHTAKSIWKQEPVVEELNGMGRDTMLDHIGIEFTAVGDDYLEARMPVDRRTRQPYGLLHGGASLVLAETLASVAAVMSCEKGRHAVGVEINANHLRRARSGWVTGRVEPVRLGSRLQVWRVDISNDSGELVCVSRATLVVLDSLSDEKEDGS